jgi:hypothetical protein
VASNSLPEPYRSQALDLSRANFVALADWTAG